jgi:hypothetical protein
MVAVQDARSIVGVLWPEAWRASAPEASETGISLMVDEKF